MHSLFLFCLVGVPACFAGTLMRIKRESEKCVCVPYYQCGPDNKIDPYGTDQLNERRMRRELGSNGATFDEIEKLNRSMLINKKTGETVEDLDLVPRFPLDAYSNLVCTDIDICCGLPENYVWNTGFPPEPRPETTTKDPRNQPQPPISNPPIDGSEIHIPQTPPGLTGCGVRRINPNQSENDATTGITGNGDVPRRAFYGEVPWMAAIFREEREGKDLICGGSIIAPGVVLTAAFCVVQTLDKMHEVVVRAGDWDSRYTNEPIPHQERRVNRILVHEGYNSSGPGYNNVALLILESPFELGVTIDTVCLVREGSFQPKNCWATGWGTISFGGPNEPILKKIYLPLVDRDTCQASWRERLRNNFEIHESNICAGGLAQDTCIGDGGGPLVCSGVDGNHLKYAQIGIISWGHRCGEGIPGIYSSVNHFYDWITDQVQL